MSIEFIVMAACLRKLVKKKVLKASFAKRLIGKELEPSCCPLLLLYRDKQQNIIN